MSKTELAIATDFHGESAGFEDVERLLKNIAEAGFSHIHWCHEWDGDYTYSKYEMEQIKEWMECCHLKAKSLHASKGTKRDVNVRGAQYRRDYTASRECCRKAGVELIKNRVDLAAFIGAAEIVLHLYVPFISIQKGELTTVEFYENIEKSMDELMPYCLEKGVRICIENMFDMPEKYMTQQWDWVMEKYPSRFLGFCFDTGHAYMLWRERMPEIIRRYGERIYSVHLHDNYGTVDYHMLPGEGDIDWAEVMSALSESAYELPLTMEVGGCKEDEKEYLARAYEAGERLNQMWSNGRKF